MFKGSKFRTSAFVGEQYPQLQTPCMSAGESCVSDPESESGESESDEESELPIASE